MEQNEIVNRIISIAQNVHSEIGPGLDEAIYKKCMHIELENWGIPFEENKPLFIKYDSVEIPTDCLIDFLLDDRVVIQVKSVDSLTDEDHTEIFSFLKCRNYPFGVLINFNVVSLETGIRKVFNR
jgi:GxxExxY protein